MMIEGASDRIETDTDLESCKLEEKLSETKSEPQVGDNLESTGLMLSCDLERKYVQSDAILGEKTDQPQQKSEEVLIAVDGNVQGVKDDKNIDTTIRQEHDAKTSAAQEEEMVKTTGFCNDDVDMDGQDNMHLSNSGGLSALTGNKDRVSATSASDSSKQHFSLLHQTSSTCTPSPTRPLHLWNWLLWKHRCQVK